MIQRTKIEEELLAACKAALNFLSQSSKFDWDGELTFQLEEAVKKAEK